MRKENHKIEGQYKINFEEFDLEAPSGIMEKPSVEISKGPVELSRRLNYISIGSGSSGNCCYLGNSRGGILIDAGVRVDVVESVLKANGISMDKVRAILLTHDHSDHIQYVYTFLRSYRYMTLFCTNRVLNAILRRHSISKRIKEYHTPIYKEFPFRIVDFEVTAFDVPHDSSDSMGYSIEFDNRSFVIATDMGIINERTKHYISKANYLVLESNYDKQMLINGRYPEYLKARIMSERGHMDNSSTAQFLAEVANPNLKYVFLCHLSQDNNTPEKAFETSKKALEGEGISVIDSRIHVSSKDGVIHLMPLPRTTASPWFVFYPF